MQRPLGLDPFATQSRLEHALTVIVGLGLFWVVYFSAVFAIYGELSMLALESSVTEQRVGGVAGSVAVWTYFGIAFVRGYGGPVLNSFVYPLVIAILAPFPARWLLFGIDVSGLVSRYVGLVILEPALTTLLVTLPGFGAFMIVLTIWATVLDEESREEWERTHLTTEFYQEFVTRESEKKSS